MPPPSTVLTLLGLILLCLPVVLRTIADKNKYIGFANGILEIVIVQTIIVLVFQFLHLFVYPLIISANIVYVLWRTLHFMAQKTFLNGISSSLNSDRFKLKDFDWMLLLVLALSVWCLFQVNYKYTGKINDIKLNRYIEVKDFTYPYPYFADEWYTVAFIKKSIENHSLPFKNPFYRNAPFIDLEFVSHSFLSEITLLLALNPLVDYTKMTVGFNALIVVLIYLFLRYINISYLTAGISAPAALFITNTAILPGIWSLIPLTVGVITLLLCLYYFEQGNIKMILLAAFLGLIFYPPLVAIITPAFFYFILKEGKTFEEPSDKISLKYILMVLISALAITTAFLSNPKELNERLPLIISKFFYCPFDNAKPSFTIWHILPWPTIILTLVAFFNFDKGRRWLKLMAITSLAFWFIYSFIQYRFVIEYERVVYVSSVLLVILSGMGLDQSLKYLSRFTLINQYQIIKYFQLLVLMLILMQSLNYTSREPWKKLSTYYYDLKKTFLPGAPANMYLTQDDLRIFKSLHLQSFLSLPWKGTVIGTATDNYPRCTKSGTVNINTNLFTAFYNANCDGKIRIAEYVNIKYFYVPPFNCQYFSYKDQSSEGLTLYEFVE